MPHISEVKVSSENFNIRHYPLTTVGDLINLCACARIRFLEVKGSDIIDF